MTNEQLEAYLKQTRFRVEDIEGADHNHYIVIRDYPITVGSLAGHTCDVAIQRVTSVPYVLPSAIHTRPELIPMGTRNTQQSGIGSDWQYWSRVLRTPPTPRAIVTHIATVFSEV
jgi:hypothetical protein